MKGSTATLIVTLRKEKKKPLHVPVKVWECSACNFEIVTPEKKEESTANKSQGI